MAHSTANILWKHVQAADLCPGSRSLDEWLHVRWIRVRVGHWSIPIFPVIGYRDGLILHDVHHVVTGYGTSVVGEIEIAAWELASGGCGWIMLFWIIQIATALLGLIVCPRRTIRAFQAGWSQRNLYLLDAQHVLALDFEEIVRHVRRSS